MVCALGSGCVATNSSVYEPESAKIDPKSVERDPLAGLDRWTSFRMALEDPESVTFVAPIAPEPSTDASKSRSSSAQFQDQLALARLGFSSGSLDGVPGPRTEQAVKAFQESHGLQPRGWIDDQTRALIPEIENIYTEYTVTQDDLNSLTKNSDLWAERAQQKAMNHETILELVAEKGRCYQHIVQRLNPSINWSKVKAGTKIKIPNAYYPEPNRRVSYLTINLDDRTLQAFDASGDIIVHFPCSIGRLATQQPTGELEVINRALRPNYTFDPKVFPENEEARSLSKKLIIPPGPNNPVGLAWMGLSKPGYGIHGTPIPEFIGQTQSHGCFRLANWDATYLIKIVREGDRVRITR